MKNIIFLIFLFISYHYFAFSQWVNCSNGINNDTIMCMAINNENLFVSTYHSGIFRSLDNGNTFTKLTTGSKYYPVYTIILDSNKIFATDDNGFYFSSDYGNSWNFRLGPGNGNLIGILKNSIVIPEFPFAVLLQH